MSSPPKNYKIIVDSKHFRNMKGICPAEVAKKAAGKILSLSNNRITQFSIIETKNGKIRNYKAFKENLIRPYNKNGKLIKCRIIVKKLVKHTGGELKNLLVKSKREFTEEEIERIKDEMFIKNNLIDNYKIKYEPYNLSEKIKELFDYKKNEGLNIFDNFELGENDPILHFFSIFEFKIEFHFHNIGWMTLKYIKRQGCNIFYEFTGNEDSFKLHIYNLASCFDNLTKDDALCLVYCWEEYIKFLGKLYPEAIIHFDFYYHVPDSNKNRNHGMGILKVPIFLPNIKSSLSQKQKNYINSVTRDFCAHFKNNESNSNSVLFSINDK
jgi:hypothetical protein